MAWSTGTSTDWQDLLDDLRAAAIATTDWTTDRYDTSVGGDSNVDEWIAHGDGGGSDEIYVGIRTFYDSSADARNWELAGMTGYDNGLGFGNQPGISPGRYDGAGDAQYGAYLPLQNTTISYWFSITSRRIIVVAKCGTTYEPMVLGWGNPFGTSAEYPYPMVVAGSTPVFDTRFNSSRVAHSGLADPQGYSVGGDKAGPMLVRDPGGTWRSIMNAVEGTSNSRSVRNDRVVFPAGRPSLTASILPDEADRFVLVNSAVLASIDIIPQSGVPGTQTVKLYKTDDSGGDLAPLFPATVIMAPDDVEHLIAMELPDIFWLSAAPGQTDGGINSEDTITIGGDTYHVFQSANRTEDYAYFAVKEV